ncbi:MAG: hypothetical protein M3N54_05140 [Acidobacteriota bacterium]|nr:hypothetical protein [Acidobacteriota bacterium]
MVRRLFQAIETRKDLFAALQSLATIAALAVGGLWTYKLTRQFRETEPILTIKQNVSSWKLKNGAALIRVDSLLTNASKVRIDSVNGVMIVQRLLPETPEQAANYAAGNIWFSCKDKRGQLSPGCVSEQGLNLPASSTKQFTISDVTGSLEPGESVPYWRYLPLDRDVKTIEVYTDIRKPNGGDWDFDSVFDLEFASDTGQRPAKHAHPDKNKSAPLK